ncbi:MAG TPA: redoxin domain-containing protein, partial [Bacteroidota bacterium]|nr:redoxin domain-containing protein [Bacteroidota bacterium]
GFNHSTDFAAAKKSLAKELELYPESWKPRLVLWDIALKENDNEETRANIHKEVDAVYSSGKGNDEAYWDLIQWYEKLGDSSSAARLIHEANEKFPGGKSALLIRYREITKNKDLSRKPEMLEKLLVDFPTMDEKQKENYMVSLSRAYISTKNFDKAADVLSKLKHPMASYYNALSWPLIEKGEQLDKAVPWAKHGVDLARNPDPSDKPGYYKRKDWDEQSKEMLDMVLDTYGYGLLQLNKNEEAEKIYREVYDDSKGEDPDMDAHYVEALVHNKHFEEALITGRQCIEELHESPKLTEMMKEAYAKKEGSEKGFDALPADKQKKFDAMIAEANSVKIEKLRKKLLASRTNTPSIDFTMRDLQGTPVVLSSLKGKIVVLDFWATWCGPCRASFPYYQKVYEKYQKNSHVVFLAVDSWEGLKDVAATVANAKKFLDDNKYTFPVVLDDKVGEKYKVTGIPTKFIIDKNGEIAFTTIGFDGPGMEDELTQQIEILLGEIVGSVE